MAPIRPKTERELLLDITKTVEYLSSRLNEHIERQDKTWDVTMSSIAAHQDQQQEIETRVVVLEMFKRDIIRVSMIIVALGVTLLFEIATGKIGLIYK